MCFRRGKGANPRDPAGFGTGDSTTVMRLNRTETRIAPPVPPILVFWRAVSRVCFTSLVWRHIQVLVAGAIPALGERAVTQALRVMRPAEQSRFGRPRGFPCLGQVPRLRKSSSCCSNGSWRLCAWPHEARKLAMSIRKLLPAGKPAAYPHSPTAAAITRFNAPRSIA